MEEGWKQRGELPVPRGTEGYFTDLYIMAVTRLAYSSVASERFEANSRIQAMDLAGIFHLAE